MTWQIILTSAAISTLISILGGIYSKKIDFDYNYKTYILEKRKLAYNMAEIFLNSLSTVLILQPNETDPEKSFLASKEKLSLYISQIEDINVHHFWLTSLFKQKLYEIYQEFQYHYLEYDDLKQKRADGNLKIWYPELNHLIKLVRELSNLFIADIKNLKKNNYSSSIENVIRPTDALKSA